MVGGGKDIYTTFGGIVEHTEELVDFTVIVLVCLVTGAFGHHGIELVEEQQCGSFFLCVFEYFAYLLLCSVYPSTGEVVRHDLHEVDAYLLGHLLGEERLAATSRTIKEHGGWLDAIHLGALAVLQNVDETFSHELLQLIHARNVSKPMPFDFLLCHRLVLSLFCGGCLLFCYRLSSAYAAQPVFLGF